MDPQTATLPLSDRQLEKPLTEIRLPNLAIATRNFSTLSNPLPELDRRTTSLQNSPPGSDLLEQDIRLSLAPGWLSTSSPGRKPITPAVETSTTTVSAPQAKRIRGEIKGHAIAHHHHRPPKHGQESLLARIGRSVKEALIHAVTFARD